MHPTRAARVAAATRDALVAVMAADQVMGVAVVAALDHMLVEAAEASLWNRIRPDRKLFR